MIINGKDLQELKVFAPAVHYKKTHRAKNGRRTSYGLTECGYDIRLDQDVWLFLGRRFVLASSMEHFNMPNHLRGRVENKSTMVRLGVDASRTTNVEPGWRGYLTLELHYSRVMPLFLERGTGIASIIFEELKNPSQYVGPYQDQRRGPVGAL